MNDAREALAAPPTRAELRRHQCWVWIHGKLGCLRRAPMTLAPAIIYWGPDASSDLLRERVRCSDPAPQGPRLSVVAVAVEAIVVAAPPVGAAGVERPSPQPIAPVVRVAVAVGVGHAVEQMRMPMVVVMTTMVMMTMMVVAMMTVMMMADDDDGGGDRARDGGDGGGDDAAPAARALQRAVTARAALKTPASRTQPLRWQRRPMSFWSTLCLLPSSEPT